MFSSLKNITVGRNKYGWSNAKTVLEMTIKV